MPEPMFVPPPFFRPSGWRVHGFWFAWTLATVHFVPRNKKTAEEKRRAFEPMIAEAAKQRKIIEKRYDRVFVPARPAIHSATCSSMVICVATRATAKRYG